jgi:hypothetical protein
LEYKHENLNHILSINILIDGIVRATCIFPEIYKTIPSIKIFIDNI